jgi:AcrR family transcriptional regulator
MGAKESAMTSKKVYHHGSLKSTLVALAARDIEESGVDGVSVRALAKEAGVAHRAAYQHFPDKDALIAAALADAYDRLAARCAAAFAGQKTIEGRLKAVALAYAAFAQAEPNMFLAMSGPRINLDGEHTSLEASIGRAWRHIAGPIGEAVDSGRFTLDDKRAAAAIFWGGLQGILVQAALGRLKVKPSERNAFFNIVADRLIAGLKA